MSKQLIVDRHTTPGTPVLDPVATVKVPVYDTLADVEADLANLSEGQIVVTTDTGDELSHPVNVVEEGNLHAVSSNAVAESLSYSTTEQKTGGVWIDGKPIYRKVVPIPFTAGATVTATISGVTLSDFQVIDMGHSFIYDSTYGTRQPWGANGNSDVEIFYVSEGTIRFKTTHPDGTFYAVVEYTKTTD